MTKKRQGTSTSGRAAERGQRGVRPKDDEGNVRPIVVGSVFLRLIGSLGLQLNRGACDDYFMGPSVRGKQYGVGTKDGCTLMAASIEAFMESNPGSIDIAGGTMNAFNKF